MNGRVGTRVWLSRAGAWLRGVCVWGACVGLVGLAGAAGAGGGGAAGVAELQLRPYRGNGWAEAQAVPEVTVVPVREEERAGMGDLFLRVDALRLRVARRVEAHRFWLGLTGEEESDASDATVRFELHWQGRAYAFDRWGRFVIDRRFVYPEDAELLTHFEAFYLQRLRASPLAGKWGPERRPDAAAVEVPVFAGFEDDRYQKHDALIVKLVAEFNRDRSKAVGAPAGLKVTTPDLTPALVKALMIEESGGRGPRSLEAWERDPLQVNVPGDWSEEKAALGLKKPKNRNEGSLEGNLRAGIRYLARKGFGSSGAALSKRPGAYFDSWRMALQRYNGRTKNLHDGRTYRMAYAERILRRAAEPDRFVPIAVVR